MPIINLSASLTERSKLGLGRRDFLNVAFLFSSTHYKSLRCPFRKRHGEESCPFLHR